jgi:hypothetical protein
MSTIDKAMEPGAQVTFRECSDMKHDLQIDTQPETSHTEVVEKPFNSTGGIHEHDTAMALFDSTDDLHQELHHQEIRRLRRRVDFLIMPCLLICFAFFYIDKVGAKICLDIQ